MWDVYCKECGEVIATGDIEWASCFAAIHSMSQDHETKVRIRPNEQAVMDTQGKETPSEKESGSV